MCREEPKTGNNPNVHQQVDNKLWLWLSNGNTKEDTYNMNCKNNTLREARHKTGHAT